MAENNTPTKSLDGHKAPEQVNKAPSGTKFILVAAVSAALFSTAAQA